jgi:hypothetical protein
MLKTRDIPNLLTGARIVFSVAVFFGLLAAAGVFPGQAARPGPAAQRAVVLWSLGAGLGGFLGSGASIVQMTRYACITVGVGWPLILPRLIDSFTKEEDQQEPD